MESEKKFSYMQACKVAETLAREAGAKCLDLQSQLGEVLYKTAKDVVTIADVTSEKIIVDGLKKEFPEIPVRTEEGGRIAGESSRYEWIIDPVDGTVNFSRGIPLWGISIALMEDGKPVACAVFLPALREMHTAVKGGGAFCNGKKLQVSATDKLIHAIVSNGDFNVGDWEKTNARNIRNFDREAKSCMRVKCYGSAVIEGTLTAAGKLDIFSMTMSFPWDIAGIALLVTEAGGRATEPDGSELKFVDGEMAIFTNGILHSVAVDMLR